MDVEAVFSTDGEAAELAEQGEGLFDDPAAGVLSSRVRRMIGVMPRARTRRSGSRSTPMLVAKPFGIVYEIKPGHLSYKRATQRIRAWQTLQPGHGAGRAVGEVVPTNL